MGAFAERFAYNLDAAFLGSDGHIYLFKDKYFYSSGRPDLELRVKDTWGKVNNNFHNPGDEANIDLDAAFYAPNGYTYLFKGGQYLRYSSIDNEYVDEGYPKATKNNWGDMVRALPDLAVEEGDLRRISVPVCSIVGGRDPLRAGVDAMTGLIEDHEVTVLEGADHIRAPRRPELLATLKPFLHQHSPDRA